MGIMLKFTIIVFLFLSTMGSAADSGSSAQELHKSILSALDEGRYQETAQLLVKLKQEQPARYNDLPYALLHAHSLALSNNFKEAYPIYEGLVSDTRLAPFVLLPLARIAAQQGVVNTAVRYYQEYLRHTYPDYVSVAREALDYCWQLKKADALYNTSQVIQKSSTLDRIAQLYLGRSYVLRGDRELARNLFLSLMASRKKDDVTNLALGELDLLEGTQISSQEKQRRGKLAYDVWNFELARKYLEPVAAQNMDNGFYYARTLFFLGDFENSRKAFQATLSAWPNDPKYSYCLYQYANVYFREGNYAKASELYKQLKNSAKGEIQETAAFKMIYAFRAQSRFPEALTALEPYTRARNLKTRGGALSLRGRIYFQMGRFKNSYDDFQQALQLKPFRNEKELLLWKAITLEKLNRHAEARSLYWSLAGGYDFFSDKAREKVALPLQSSTQNGLVRLPVLPDASRENEILSTYASGEVIPALLYLHLYDEASQTLPDLDQTTWRILGVDEKNRLQRFLAISFLAGLGSNYSTATYYSELFLKNVPKGIPLFSFPPEVLKALFPLPYKEEVGHFSRERQIDPFLVLSIMKQESKFKRFARSQTFARGLMQIIPSTAARLATSLNLPNFSVDQLYLPEVNINLGTRYVQDIVREFGNQVEMIAAGYNGGEPNVRRWRDCSTPNEILDFVSSIDFSETKSYVMIVKSNYELYKRIYAGAFTGPTGNSSKH
jgi:soluble lytic murein transglycosylase